jgi:hypothetical protein
VVRTGETTSTFTKSSTQSTTTGQPQIGGLGPMFGG